MIQVPDGGYYMWDTGKEEDYPMVERLLDIKKLERLDGIFLSHGHKDHAGGLELIMEKYSVRWSFKVTLFLMTGDMEKKEEKQFLQTFRDCRADVLKLGHHGEKDATSKALLEAVMPVYGIITGNEEENPDSVNKKIAERLKKYGVKAYYSEGEQTAWDFIADGTSVKAVKVMDK